MNNKKSDAKRGPGVSINLKDVPPDMLLSIEVVAKFLRVACRTVQRMEARHELPRPVRIGRRLYWNAGHLLAWINRLVKEGEQETEAELKRVRDFA